MNAHNVRLVMARPKTLQQPEKLNISIERDAKRKAFAMATKEGVSISAMITQLINRHWESGNEKPCFCK
jgi:hypothetical protein